MIPERPPRHWVKIRQDIPEACRKHIEQRRIPGADAEQEEESRPGVTWPSTRRQQDYRITAADEALIHAYLAQEPYAPPGVGPNGAGTRRPLGLKGERKGDWYVKFPNFYLVGNGDVTQSVLGHWMKAWGQPLGDYSYRLPPWAKTKLAADAVNWQPILKELMGVLKPGLPEPSIKIVNSKVNWLGRCIWQLGAENTAIEIQKSIMSDEPTVRRILAHELAHHEDDLVNRSEKVRRLGIATYNMLRNKSDGHGPDWQAIAARFNARYGADFVTKTSDESYVEDDGPVRPFFVLMNLHGGQLRWSHADLLSRSMRLALAQRAKLVAAGQAAYRLIVSTDPFFRRHTPLIGSGKLVHPQNDEEKAKAEQLWAEPDVLAQYLDPNDADMGPYFVLMGRYLRGKLAWQHAKNLTPKIKEYLGKIRQDDGVHLFRTTDPFFLDSPKITPNGRLHFARNEEEQSKAEALWNGGEVVPFGAQEKSAAVSPNTQAFKAWFAGSKVADANGQPIIMYHGTSEPFSRVNMGAGAQGLFWMTSDLEGLKSGNSGAVSTKTILRCYVSIKNPARWKEYERYGIGELKREGYDGIILDDPDGSFNAVVFKANQVKILPPEKPKTAAPAPDTQEFSAWFSGSKVVDANGQPLQVYRGDYRGDKLGDKFKVNKSTSGRFYFTDDPEIASNYSKDKPDGQYVEENQEFANWFRFPEYRYPRERRAPDLAQVWHRLSPEQRARVKYVALNTTQEEGDLIFDAGNAINSQQGMTEYAQRAGGNWLVALAEAWLSSGTLYGEERTFGQILRQTGIHFEYDNPGEPRSTVTAVFLHITHPLDTSAIPQHVIDHLRQMAQKDRGRAKSIGYDAWDKTTLTIRDWVAKLDQDLEEGTTYAWTTLPEKVTKALQAMGYDGIKDTGGKMGGKAHTVWIAFEPNQIKSAIGNKGSYSRERESILASKVAASANAGQEAPQWLMDHAKKNGLDPAHTETAWQAMQEARPQIAADNLKIAHEKGFEVTPDDQLVLYHGTRLGNAIRKSGFLRAGSFLTAKKDDALGYANAAQNRGKAEVIRLEVFPGYGVLSGNGYFQAREPIPLGRAKTAVASPAFQSWFGKSKVVNPDGTPKRVYHGTAADIAEFNYKFTGNGNDQHGSGFYFTDKPDTAAGYAYAEHSDGAGPNVMPVYLSLQNPIFIDNAGDCHQSPLTRSQVAQIVRSSPVLDRLLEDWGDVASDGKESVLRHAVSTYTNSADLKYQLFTMGNDCYPDADAEEFNKIMHKATGYDGVIVTMGEETQYVAWFPNQIKSAIGNNGNYDHKERAIAAGFKSTFLQAAE